MHLLILLYTKKIHSLKIRIRTAFTHITTEKMNPNDKNHSSSDDEQSDEDYNPLKEKATELSEEESDDAISECDDEELRTTAVRTKQRNQKNVQKKKRRQSNVGAAVTGNNDEVYNSINTAASLESESPTKADDDKEKADALWADFLSGTDDAYKKPVVKVSAVTASTNTKDIQQSENKALEVTEKKRIVKETVEYAGEKIDIVKEVPIMPSASSSTRSGANKVEIPLKNVGKRSFGGGGGLSTLLGQIGKKSKISTLEKTKLDWNTFKRNEGIDEQLQTHNKGKDGYLERQDFLQRTDVRQFQLEKNLRQTKRTNR